MSRTRNRPRAFPRRLSNALIGRQPTDSPVFSLGWQGQQWAMLAGPLDADSTAALHIAGGVNRHYRPAATVTLSSGRIIDYFIAQVDGTQDYRVGSIYASYSDDAGETWSPLKLVYRRETAGTPDYASNSKWINGPLGAVVHRPSGRVHIVLVKSDGPDGSQVMTPWHITSTDGLSFNTTATEITSTVLKVNNTMPAGQPACYGGSNARWNWYMITNAICIENGANAGRLYFFGDHRYTIAGTSWSHCFYTDNGDQANPTFVLGGGYDETVAGNNESNECVAVEYGSAGAVLVQNRIQSGGNANNRGQCKPSDLTTTWPAMGLATDGTNDLDAAPCHGSLWRKGNYLYAAFPVDRGVRSHIKVFRSANNGATWPVSRTIVYGSAGYSCAQALSDGRHRLLFERTHNFGTTSFSDQYTTQARFNDHWLENESLYPTVHEWGFTEAEAGLSLDTSGTQLLDIGKDGIRSTDARGLGGNNAIYFLEVSRWYLQFAGSGASPIALSEANDDGVGGATDIGKSSFTMEFTIMLPASGAGSEHVFFDNRNESGRGMTVKFNASGQLLATVVDASANSVATTPGGADKNDNTMRTYAVVFKRGVSLTCYETTSGAAVIQGSAGNAASVTGYVRGSTKAVLGCTSTGNTKHLAAGSQLDRVRITHAALTSGWMTHVGTKVTHDQFIGLEPLVPSIANYPAVSRQSHLGATYEGGYHARKDRIGLHDHIDHGSPRLGTGAKGYRCVASHTPFCYGASDTRGMFWDIDADVGPHWRHMYLSGGTANGAYASCNAAGTMGATTLWDGVHTLPAWAMFFCFKRLTSASIQLADNCVNSASNRGFCVSVSGAGAVTLRISNGSGSTFLNDTFGTIVVADNVWTCLGITASAVGAKVKAYKATITGKVVTVVNNGIDSTNNLPDGSALGASTQPLYILARSGGSAGVMDARFKNAMLFHANMTANNFAALCELSANY